MNNILENKQITPGEYTMDTSFRELGVSKAYSTFFRLRGFQCPKDVKNYTIDHLKIVFNYLSKEEINKAVDLIMEASLMVGVDIMQNTKDLEEMLAETRQVMSESIYSFDGLGLSGKAYAKLTKAKIFCPKDMMNFTYEQLLSVPNIGPLLADEIIKKLLLRGIDIMRNTQEVKSGLRVDPCFKSPSTDSFDSLELSARACHILYYNGIYCPSDMSDFTLERLREIEKIGPVMAEEIVDKLLLCGIDIIENSAKKIIDDKKPSQDKPVKTYVK